MARVEFEGSTSSSPAQLSVSFYRGHVVVAVKVDKSLGIYEYLFSLLPPCHLVTRASTLSQPQLKLHRIAGFLWLRIIHRDHPWRVLQGTGTTPKALNIMTSATRPKHILRTLIMKQQPAVTLLQCHKSSKRRIAIQGGRQNHKKCPSTKPNNRTSPSPQKNLTPSGSSIRWLAVKLPPDASIIRNDFTPVEWDL